jgi:heat shock protein HtpX
MSTLYSQAESNVRKTWFLITSFLLLVIFIGWIFSNAFEMPSILYFAVGFSVLTSVSSYWFSDKIILTTTNAKLIEKKDNPEIYRLVENLCISSGMPMPKIYILEDEYQPNAFATGRDEKHSAIALTKGLLTRLERVEIEGVIAHELSHIKNKDILLQTVVVVLAGVITILSDILLRSGFRKRDNDNNNYIFIILGILAAILAPLAASIIKAALSRQREFLADASGALLTRYPEGLASALDKIASDETPLLKANSSNAHLFIASPFREDEDGKISWVARLFNTHPPVEERIKALMGMKI